MAIKTFPSNLRTGSTLGNGHPTDAGYEQNMALFKSVIMSSPASEFVFTGCTCEGNVGNLGSNILLGTLVIDGRLIELSATETGPTLTASATNHMWGILTENGSGEATGMTFAATLSRTSPPTGKVVFLGELETNATQATQYNAVPFHPGPILIGQYTGNAAVTGDFVVATPVRIRQAKVIGADYIDDADPTKYHEGISADDPTHILAAGAAGGWYGLGTVDEEFLLTDKVKRPWIDPSGWGFGVRMFWNGGGGDPATGFNIGALHSGPAKYVYHVSPV